MSSGSSPKSSSPFTYSAWSRWRRSCSFRSSFPFSLSISCFVLFKLSVTRLMSARRSFVVCLKCKMFSSIYLPSSTCLNSKKASCLSIAARFGFSESTFSDRASWFSSLVSSSFLWAFTAYSSSYCCFFAASCTALNASGLESIYLLIASLCWEVFLYKSLIWLKTSLTFLRESISPMSSLVPSRNSFVVFWIAAVSSWL